jgi:hypothetical protein
MCIEDAKPHDLRRGDRVRWISEDLYICDRLVIRKGDVAVILAVESDNRIWLNEGPIRGMFGATEPGIVEKVCA